MSHENEILILRSRLPSDIREAIDNPTPLTPKQISSRRRFFETFREAYEQGIKFAKSHFLPTTEPATKPPDSHHR